MFSRYNDPNAFKSNDEIICHKCCKKGAYYVGEHLDIYWRYLCTKCAKETQDEKNKEYERLRKVAEEKQKKDEEQQKIEKQRAYEEKKRQLQLDPNRKIQYCEGCHTNSKYCDIYYCQWEGHSDIEFDYKLCEQCFEKYCQRHWNLGLSIKDLI